MKKYIVLIILATLYSCDSHTYDDISEPIETGEIITYVADVKPIIDGNCISCHSAGGTASFRPLTTYAEVTGAIQNAGLLQRIQLANGEPGLMPQTGRMPQTTINVVLEWVNGGMPKN
ncbi:cytochrome c [Flavobacterium rhizosphaerae]|uniref:Cytochrome c n=1 Tax=Flavobacterium rhizosphaerae TaxID=3163298 RepID=A0ABW8YYE9_9FLAO